MMRVKKVTLPKAVSSYVKRTELDEKDVRDYILRQIELYQGIPDKVGTLKQWIGLKIDCFSSAAAEAIKWAIEQFPTDVEGR